MPENTTYGVDAITFYDPAFWGVGSYDEILAIRDREPKRLWEKIFDSLNEAGITGLELTFPPADWRSAQDAYGSAAAFKEAADARGIHLTGGFIMATDWGITLDGHAALHNEALAYADFLGEAGGGVLVAGPPMRRTRNAEPPLFIDLEFAKRFIDAAHIVGDATLRRGVKLALHTEANSMFCTRRDINLVLSLADPEYIYFCPDTAHIVLAGGDPVEIVADHLERVAIAHWKDATGPMPAGIPIHGQQIHEEHRKYMTSLGTGVVNWTAWSALYDRSPAANIRLLELDAAPNPISEMKKALTYLG